MHIDKGIDEYMTSTFLNNTEIKLYTSKIVNSTLEM
jgi:hypothetical protein